MSVASSASRQTARCQSPRQVMRRLFSRDAESAYIRVETILESANCPIRLCLKTPVEVRVPHRTPARRAFIKSFGCQMNVYDAERMADIAARRATARLRTVEDADLIVLNTCHIRERASEKIYSELGKLRELKEERRRARPADDARRRRLRRPGRRGGNPAPPAGGRCRRRSAELSSPAAAPARSAPSARRRRRRLPGRGQVLDLPEPGPTRSPGAASPRSSPCRRAATSSARSASCPTRAAPRPRAPVRRRPRRDRAPRRGRRARGHAHRAERQRLSRAGQSMAARSGSPA